MLTASPSDAHAVRMQDAVAVQKHVFPEHTHTHVVHVSAHTHTYPMYLCVLFNLPTESTRHREIDGRLRKWFAHLSQ